MGMTYKPCPGCGEKGLRRADKVCVKCEELLRISYVAHASEARKTAPKKLFRLTKEWPSIYWPRDGSDELPKKLIEAWSELAREVLSPSSSNLNPYDESVIPVPAPKKSVNYFSTHDENASLWTAPQRIVDALEKLDLLVRAAVLDAYHQGETSGSNLLTRLAGGQVTIAELTEAQIEAGRRRNHEHR